MDINLFLLSQVMLSLKILSGKNKKTLKTKVLRRDSGDLEEENG